MSVPVIPHACMKCGRVYLYLSDKNKVIRDFNELSDEKKKEILDEYKGITQDDIRACFLFATKSLENTEFMPLVAETGS